MTGAECGLGVHGARLHAILLATAERRWGHIEALDRDQLDAVADWMTRTVDYVELELIGAATLADAVSHLRCAAWWAATHHDAWDGMALGAIADVLEEAPSA